MIDPGLEQSMLEGLRPSDQGTQILLDGHRVEQVLGSLRDSVAAVESQGLSAVLVCAPALRPAIHRLVSAQQNGLPVLSYQEATAAGSTIETVGVVRASDAIVA
jgi:flagellar biosynthesis protein FlhA